MRLTLLTYNILDGGRGREKELCNLLAAQNADVILIQEAAGQALVETLAARLDSGFFIAESNSARTLALLSRLPMRQASSFHPRTLRHTCLEVTLEYAPNQTLALFGVHLAAPAFTLRVEWYRWRELKLILERIAAARGERVIVAGDFNSLAPGDRPNFKLLPLSLRLSIFLQGASAARQVIGTMRARRFTDAFRILNPEANGFTFPAPDPNARLDYFFVNGALCPTLRQCEVVVSPANVRSASDHLPLRLELEL